MDRSASSSSLPNRSISACAFSSCRRSVSFSRVSCSTLADSLDSLPLIQLKITKLAGFVHCLVKISRFHKALNPVNKYNYFTTIVTENLVGLINVELAVCCLLAFPRRVQPYINDVPQRARRLSPARLSMAFQKGAK